MNFDRLSRRQYVVLWEPNGFDGNGDTKFEAPVEVPYVRLKEGITQSVTAEGTPVGYTATLYTERAVPVGSLVWEGRLAALPDDPSPLYEAVAPERSPGPQNKSTNRAVQLQRWKGGAVPVA